MGLPSKYAAGPAESRRGTISGRPLPAALTAAIAVALPPAGAASAAGKDPAVARAGTAARPPRTTLLSTDPYTSSYSRHKTGAVPGIRVMPPPVSRAPAGSIRDMTISGPDWRAS
jgi:hypothetical protein